MTYKDVVLNKKIYLLDTINVKYYACILDLYLMHLCENVKVRATVILIRTTNLFLKL